MEFGWAILNNNLSRAAALIWFCHHLKDPDPSHTWKSQRHIHPFFRLLQNCQQKSLAKLSTALVKLLNPEGVCAKRRALKSHCWSAALPPASQHIASIFFCFSKFSSPFCIFTYIWIFCAVVIVRPFSIHTTTTTTTVRFWHSCGFCCYSIFSFVHSTHLYGCLVDNFTLCTYTPQHTESKILNDIFQG